MLNRSDDGDDDFDEVLEEQIEIVESLLERGASLDLQDFEGRSAVHAVCQKGLCGMVQQLFDMGANKNLEDNLGRTLLFYACCHSDDAQCELIVTLLTEQGAAMVFDVRSSTGCTLIHTTSMRGVLDAVHLPSHSGARVNLQGG